MRESAAVKGRRLLTEGRLRVVAASEHHVVAYVVGDSAERYVVTADAEGYTCSCVARGRCSHMIAAQLCTMRPLLPG